MAEHENWYLPYMDKKTKGVEVEERPHPVAVFYCAGASNVGQSTISACQGAVREVGYAKAALMCLASISAELPNITNGTKQSKGILAVDGCPMQCAKRTLVKFGFTPDDSVVISRDYEIKKNFVVVGEEGMDKVAQDLARRIEAIDARQDAELQDSKGVEAKDNTKGE